MCALLCLALCAVSGEFAAQPLSGEPITGTVLEINSERLQLQTATGPRTIAIRELMSLAARDVKPSASEPQVWLALSDGSRLVGRQLLVEEDRLTVTLLSGRELSLPRNTLRHVRFVAPEDEIDPQWRDVLKAAAAGDMVVVRKTNALDTLEGVVHGIAADTVDFEFDDNRVQVPRRRLEGIVLFQRGVDTSQALCRVSDRLGNSWTVADISSRQEELQLKLVAGPPIQLNLSDLRQIDFSTANVVYLADLAPEGVEWTPYLPSRVVSDKLDRLFSPRRNASFVGGPLTLAVGGQPREFARGLAIHSRTRMVFRLQDDYRRFQALAGIDYQLRRAGHVELTISGDGRELYRGTIAGSEDPVELNLNIEGLRRLEIFVDYGEDLDIADHLNLCDARLTK